VISNPIAQAKTYRLPAPHAKRPPGLHLYDCRRRCRTRAFDLTTSHPGPLGFSAATSRPVERTRLRRDVMEVKGIYAYPN